MAKIGAKVPTFGPPVKFSQFFARQLGPNHQSFLTGRRWAVSEITGRLAKTVLRQNKALPTIVWLP